MPVRRSANRSGTAVSDRHPHSQCVSSLYGAPYRKQGSLPGSGTNERAGYRQGEAGSGVRTFLGPRRAEFSLAFSMGAALLKQGVDLVEEFSAARDRLIAAGNEFLWAWLLVRSSLGDRRGLRARLLALFVLLSPLRHKKPLVTVSV